MKTLRVQERSQAEALQNIVQLEITIRYPRDFTVDEDDILVLDGDTLNIATTDNPDRMKEWLVMTCIAGGAD